MPKQEGEVAKLDVRIRRIESAVSAAFMTSSSTITKTWEKLCGVSKCKESRHWESDKNIVWQGVRQLLIECDTETEQAGFHEFKDGTLTKTRPFTAAEKTGYTEARDSLIECSGSLVPAHDIDVIFWREDDEGNKSGTKKSGSSSSNGGGRGRWFTIKLRHGSVRCGLVLDALNNTFGKDLTLRCGAEGAIKIYRAQRGGKKNKKGRKKRDSSSEEEEESESEEEEPKNKKRNANNKKDKNKGEGNPKKKAAKPK